MIKVWIVTSNGEPSEEYVVVDGEYWVLERSFTDYHRVKVFNIFKHLVAEFVSKDFIGVMLMPEEDEETKENNVVTGCK